MQKEVHWYGSTQKELSRFPKRVKEAFDTRINFLTLGLRDDDSKPMTTVGKGAFELREKGIHGTEWRVVCVVKPQGHIAILHAFGKKTRTTPKRDIQMAKDRYSEHKRMVK